jgi:hypothetical protein
MADKKVTALDALTTVAADDLLLIVDDPSGTPTSKKVTAANLATYTSTGLATLASPTFTGTPAAPTAAPGTNTTQIATTEYVMAATPTVAFDSDQAILAGALFL